MTPGDPRIRFRFYADGKLTDEQWIDATDPGARDQADAIQGEHAACAAMAERIGLDWLAEVYDPAKPPGEAYLRIGTDTRMMRDPNPTVEERQHPWLR